MAANLTRDEAGTRAGLIKVHAYRVQLDLTGGDTTFRSLSRIEFDCAQAGASKRTIERLFQQETRMSMGKWRQQLRLLRSLQLLAAGEKISHAALAAGYSTPSAFIAMFRKALGTTPRKYFENGSTRS